MVSRRRILSQSRDELNFRSHEEEEDTWYNKDKLYKDHLQEVLDKWDSIDDEIWAKIVVLERNRRVAKAYARAPVLTVNGTDQGFDGFRIGLSGFENPMRDIGTEESIKQINQGFKLKMDDLGNIMIKRLTKSPVYAVNTSEENSLDHEILKLQNGLLEFEKPFKLFDMKKFQQNVNREMKRQYPERRKLERQCISMISFGSSTDILDCPIWILCINVVAMEMLRTKIPPVSGRSGGGLLDNRAHLATGAGSSDEDPYSVAGSGSSGSSGNGNTRNRSSSRDCPPQLPPRDNGIYSGQSGLWSTGTESQARTQTSGKKEKKKTGDDPYYFGLSARIPNFVKSRKKKQKERNRANPGQFADSAYSSAPSSLPPHSHPFWWHNRMYQDNSGCSGGGGEGSGFTTRAPTSFVPYVTDSSDSDYSHIYGRLPLVNRAVRKFPTKPLFLSQWE